MAPIKSFWVFDTRHLLEFTCANSNSAFHFGVWCWCLGAYNGDDWRGDNDGWFRLSGDMGAMSQDKGSGQGLRGMVAPLTVSERQPVMPVRAFFTPCFDKKQLSGCIVMCSFLPQVALRGMGTWWGDSRDKCSLRWITFETEMITNSYTWFDHTYLGFERLSFLVRVEMVRSLDETWWPE